jgi:proteasome lid subunit RPN8/RPN11
VRRDLVDHARRSAPLECCGLLVGRGRRVSFAVPMRNLARSRTRYRLDDAAHIRLRRLLRTFVDPIAIVGVYHSHPTGPPHPSATDISEAFYPEWFHVIVSRARRRWRLSAFDLAHHEDMKGMKETPIERGVARARPSAAGGLRPPETPRLPGDAVSSSPTEMLSR